MGLIDNLRKRLAVKEMATLSNSSTGKPPKRVLVTKPKAISRTRNDIKTWKEAMTLSEREEDPMNNKLQELWGLALEDNLLSSQIDNRQNKLFSIDWNLVDKNGEADEEQTQKLKEASVYRELTKHAMNAMYLRYSLVELALSKTSEGEDRIDVELIPRTNVVPQNGRFYPDIAEDKYIEYRNMREYGTWILEFQSKEQGVVNKAVKHILMKDFAQSCWAELCEIYGIPPRFLKTNTQDKQMLNRAEQMMRDMGAAAWYIIDETEEFEFADGITSKGDVYNELIKHCNNEISMLISGAIIGQDTEHGNRSKDESAQTVLWEKIMEDMVMAQDAWNKTILPALKRIGFISGDVKFKYDIPEDLQETWERVIQIIPYVDMDLEWIESKFGLKILGKKEIDTNNLNAGEGFFV